MAFTLYKSTDAAAPILTGEVGSLAALLAAVLVTGYGTKLAAGWTQPYTADAGANRVFLSAATIPVYFHVNDNGPGAGTYREARAWLYTNQATPPTGANPAPNPASLANGAFIRKSDTLSTVARTWWAFADGKTLYLNIDPGYATTPYSTLYTIGNFLPYLPGDPFPAALGARIAENIIGQDNTRYPFIYWQINPATSVGIWSCLNQNGSYAAAAAPNLTNRSPTGTQTNVEIGTTGPATPSPVGGFAFIEPFVIGALSEPRGRMRGLWIPCHTSPWIDFDTLTVNLDGVARTLTVVKTGIAATLLIESSDTLDT